MIKYIEKPKEVDIKDLLEMLSIHRDLVKNKWVKNYYHNLNELKTKVLNEIGKTKHLELAIHNQKVIGFLILNITDHKINLIEVASAYHQKNIGTKLIKFLQARYDSLLATIDSLKQDAIKKLLINTGFSQENPKSCIWRWIHK